MHYHYLSDGHVHSDCSKDGTDPAMMLCEQAASIGLYTLTITDHCECDTYWEEGYHRSVRQSFFETHKAKAAFDGRLNVLAGVELGQPLQNLQAAQDILTGCAFDFVLASAHILPGREDFYYLDYTTDLAYELLEEYFDYVLRMVHWGNFDSLAHLTYPLRYMVKSGIKVDLSRYQKEIDLILQALIKQEKALEINTSGLRQEIGCTMPEYGVIERFHQLGGRYITLGSDAHRWADVGAGIAEGLALAHKAGFTHYAIYEQRTPRLISIE